jgi:hypothetical protein
MLVSSFNLSQSFNYTPNILYKKRFKSINGVQCTSSYITKHGYTPTTNKVSSHHPWSNSESSSWIIEDQAFSPSYDLAPPPSPARQ